MLRFSHKDPKTGRFRPPPNYFSRPVQYRLLVLVGALMLVWMAMIKAADPNTWYWIWDGDPAVAGKSTITKDKPAKVDVDNRLKPKRNSSRTSPLGPVVTATSPPQNFDPTEDRMRALENAEMDAWSQVLGRLDPTERDALHVGLKAARDRAKLPESDRRAWLALIEKLDVLWKAYLDTAVKALEEETDLSQQDGKNWQRVLSQLEENWKNRLRPALPAAGQAAEPTGDQQQAISGFQAVFDRWALAAVRDDTVLRPQEYDAWFRLLDILGRTSVEDLKKRDDYTGRKGFLQLYRQTDAYRGKLVTIRGTARRAYRVPAPKNPYGIKSYYIFRIRPAAGPSTPLVVYSLRTPDGFPKIKDRYKDGGTTDLHEKVEFTGFLFKRLAYKAQDGIRTTPLVLARSPRWEPAPAPTPLPGPGLLIAAVAGAAALAVVLAVSAWAFSRRLPSSAKYSHTARARPEALAALKDAHVKPDVGTILGQMSEQEKDAATETENR